MNAASAFAGSPWFRRLRNASLILVAILAVYALLGFFAVPWFAKPKIESAATAALGRPATLGKLEFNPFTLRARLSDFSVADRSPEHPLFPLRRHGRQALAGEPLEMGPGARRGAAVASQTRGSRAIPRVPTTFRTSSIVRARRPMNRRRRFPSTTSRSTMARSRWTINSIAALSAVTQLGVGIPFLSSLPHDAEIRVSPKLSGAIDGTRFALAGTSSTPFARHREEATLDLNLDALPLTRYIAYAPLRKD